MKSILVLIGVLFLAGFISAAADVGYIVVTDSQVKQDYVDLMGEVSLTYDIIHSSDAASTNFSQYRLILMDDEYFVSWEDIPVNEVPALMVNGRNIKDWGWTRRITTASQDEPIQIVLNTTHEIKGTLPSLVPAYIHVDPDIYYLDSGDIYDGLEIIAGSTYDNMDAVIAIAHAGTDLTRGSYVTEINANGVFFGIKDNEYWTNEAKTLFKNSLLWLAGESPPGPGEFVIDLKEGHNLVSIPLELSSNDVVDIMSANPEVISVKKYDGSILETSDMNNNKGYFVECSANSTLTLHGNTITSVQNILLNNGMNLVGTVSLEDIELGELPSQVIEVSRRKSDGSYEVATKYDSGWNNEFTLEPGVGYWFKLNAEATWSYSP